MLIFNVYDTKADADIQIKVGSNAQENWDLISESKQNDIWFHLDDKPSPHVVISTPKKNKVSNQTLNYAAALCKEHSKYSNISKLTIIYTQIKNISKGDDVGSVILKKKCDKIIL
jgi:predicted ribosome quality control (RQC) complex YloA/Tae2 family protein